MKTMRAILLAVALASISHAEPVKLADGRTFEGGALKLNRATLEFANERGGRVALPLTQFDYAWVGERFPELNRKPVLEEVTKLREQVTSLRRENGELMDALDDARKKLARYETPRPREDTSAITVTRALRRTIAGAEYQMVATLDADSISFYRVEQFRDPSPEKTKAAQERAFFFSVDLRDLAEAEAVLRKFCEWRDTAKANSVLPFNKPLGQIGATTLTFYWNELGSSGFAHIVELNPFQEFDAEMVLELLPNFAEMKRDRDRRVAAGRDQQQLFK